MGRKEDTIAKIERLMFKPVEEIRSMLTEAEMRIRNRLVLCMGLKMENPLISDTELVDFLTTGCAGNCTPVSQSQAYRDLAALSRIAGNIQLAAKNWYRYMVIQACQKGIAIAMERGDVKGIAACAAVITKAKQLDKEDTEINWEEIIPPAFEPTDDITLLENVEVLDKEELEIRRKELRKLYKGKSREEYAEYEEIKEKGED